MAGFSPSGTQIGRLADWHVLLAPSGLSFEPPTGSASEIIKILAGGKDTDNCCSLMRIAVFYMRHICATANCICFVMIRTIRSKYMPV